jgi:hypothetical protein
MVEGTDVDGKISIEIGGEVSFKDENMIKVPNEELCDGTYETPCSTLFCSVTQITSFSRKAVCYSVGQGLRKRLYAIIVI